GFFSADLRNFDQVVESPVVRTATRAVYHVLPNLSSFDVTAQVVHGVHVSWRYMAVTIAYGVTYIAILLIMSVTIFSRRYFKCPASPVGRSSPPSSRFLCAGASRCLCRRCVTTWCSRPPTTRRCT